jgi:hypothetical protein
VLTLTIAAIELIHDLKARPDVGADMGLHITTHHNDENVIIMSFAEEPMTASSSRTVCGSMS